MICEVCHGNKGFCDCDAVHGFRLGSKVKFRSGRVGRVYTISKINTNSGGHNFFVLRECSEGNCEGHRWDNFFKVE